MQVTETKTEGLLHEFTITVPAAEIDTVVENRLNEMKKTAKLPGFRPGKVPVALLRKQYGPSIMGEVLERTVGETSQKALEERDLHPIVQPKIEVIKFEDGSDLEYTLSLEVMPDVKPMDFSKIVLERMVVEADEEEIDKALGRAADAYKTSEPVSGSRKSKDGNIVIIDFVGKVDGVEFDGGKAEDYSLELGSGSFIPGFEDQLTGVKVGDHVEVKVKFPDEYASEELAGKDALFDVDVKELREATPAVIDDELAKKVGAEDLNSLKVSFREEHEREFKKMARVHMKRSLLDQLEKNHDFEVPQTMADREFDGIWEQFKQHRKQAEEQGIKEDPSEGKSNDELSEDFRNIAERRVRLGLLLAEIGRINNIDINQEDVNRAMTAEAQRYPGQEQMVMDTFQKNPEAMQQLRERLMEDKVVDFIVELAKVTDKTVSLKELEAEPEGEAPVKKKTAKKKAPANKKAPAKKKD
jgi:trigger factor